MDSAPQQAPSQIMMIIPFLSFNNTVIQIFKIVYCLENNEIHFYRYLILTKLQICISFNKSASCDDTISYNLRVIQLHA